MTETNNLKYIYKISWYESKRHTKSHTDMYFLKPEHTQWAFSPCSSQIYKVFYIQVDINTENGKLYYDVAKSSSDIEDKKNN